ncbi:MAG: Ig-like domain-containing protein, partial [Planctomycetota bacterium]|nr:Ig-like domain-containing protein [Planctomycetota bacterium]
VTYASGGFWPNCVTVGDFNADGRPDLAVANSSSDTVGVLLGNGAGGFAPAVTYAAGSFFPSSVTIGDFNADGKPDLAVDSSSDRGNVGVLLGNDAGGFTTAVTYASGGSFPSSVTVGDFNADGKPDLAVANAGSGNVGVLLGASADNYRAALALASPHALSFLVQTDGFGGGQLVEGTHDAFDGLNRLRVAGQDYAPHIQPNDLTDGNRTVVTPQAMLGGLYVHREITVPLAGDEDFARTMDVFLNPTDKPISTTVRIVGNLGSDDATTVWKTSDGDRLVETTDQWIGTDDADGSGAPAIIHFLRGTVGLRPTTVRLVGDRGDNIEWTYDLTVPAGATVRLAHFTILATTRAEAETAAGVLVGADGFGGQAAAFLTPTELNSLANFVGPRVLDHAPGGEVNGPVSTLQFVFSRPMDRTSFVAKDDVVDFRNPLGATVAVNAFRWIDDTKLELTFDPQWIPGAYQLVLGPDVRSLAGTLLDQDGDGVAGQTPQDRYTAAFTLIDVTGPRIVSHVPDQPVQLLLDHVDVTFSETIKSDSFDIRDVVLASPAGAVAVGAVQFIDSHTFRILFQPQTSAGTYWITIGPEVEDLAGNRMDQDDDSANGETPDDQHTIAFTVDSPPRILRHIPSGSTVGPVNQLQFQFSEPIDQDSFAVADDIVSFVGPHGPLTVTAVTWIAADTLALAFDPQSASGLYQLILRPQILDSAGFALDQNENLVPGENPEDRYVASFDVLVGPYITGHSPSGDQTESVSEVLVTFNESLTTATFTAEDVRILGPVGEIPAIGHPVRVNGNTYRIAFDQQTAYGDYHVFVGPHIQNVGGQEMDQDRDWIVGEAIEDRYDASFTLLDVTGPHIVSHLPDKPVQGPLDHTDVTFSEAIDATSFGTGDVTISGPAGQIAVDAVQQIDPRTFRVLFPAQTIAGIYRLTIGPEVQDLPGNRMDQDQDGLKAEPHDQYTATLVIDRTPPHATGNSLTGVQNAAVRSFEVTFSEEIDAATFLRTLVTISGPDNAGGTRSVQATMVARLASDRYRV